MKKIGSFLLGAVALLTGCSGGADFSGSKYDTAEEMYVQISTQNTIALDPMNVAMRLNTLLIEADKQGLSIVDDDIVLTNNNIRLDIKRKMFGFGTRFKELAPGEYSIYYLSNYQPGVNEDNTRYGTIIINTGGKYLNDLGPGEYWTVRAEDDLKSEGIVKIEYPDFKISRIQNNQWNLSFEGCAVYWLTTSKEDCSNWNGEYVVTQRSGDQSYFSMTTAEYELDGESWGRSAFYTDQFKTEIVTPLVYKYADCGYRLTVEGEEKYILDDESQKYPTVTAVYTPHESKSCAYVIFLSYEGVTGAIDIIFSEDTESNQ